MDKEQQLLSDFLDSIHAFGAARNLSPLTVTALTCLAAKVMHDTIHEMLEKGDPDDITRVPRPDH